MKLLSIVFLLAALVATAFGTSPRCRNPIARGDASCNEDLDRYGYDSDKGQCIRFTYTGCGGNANRFNTLAECRAACA